MYSGIITADIKPGHIPNSKCLFWTQFLEGGVFKTPEQLAVLYKQAEIDPKSPHAATCGSGNKYLLFC